VFIAAGVVLIICGLIGKVGAALALIPEPIIGGTLLLGLGMVASIGISGSEKFYQNVKNDIQLDYTTKVYR
jgi:xanthine/uracil permease